MRYKITKPAQKALERIYDTFFEFAGKHHADEIIERCFHVIWNQEREAAGLDQKMSENTASAIAVAVEGIKLLIAQDKAKV